MEVVAIVVVSLIWFALGFLCGYIARKDDLLTGARAVEKWAVSRNSVKAGIIRRPTAQQLYEKGLPIHVQQERQAMRESIQTIEKET